MFGASLSDARSFRFGSTGAGIVFAKLSPLHRTERTFDLKCRFVPTSDAHKASAIRLSLAHDRPSPIGQPWGSHLCETLFPF